SRNTNRCRIAFDWKRSVLGLHNTTPFSKLPCVVTDRMILVDFPHNGSGSTAFLAKADTIIILMKGLFDFLSMLEFRPRLLNVRIAREVLRQCPCFFVNRLLLSFVSD